jgi:hypothetical protein
MKTLFNAASSAPLDLSHLPVLDQRPIDNPPLPRLHKGKDHACGTMHPRRGFIGTAGTAPGLNGLLVRGIYRRLWGVI